MPRADMGRSAEEVGNLRRDRDTLLELGSELANAAYAAVPYGDERLENAIDAWDEHTGGHDA